MISRLPLPSPPYYWTLEGFMGITWGYVDNEKRSITVTFKCTPSERALIGDKAAAYSRGIVSEWLRYASTHKPLPSDLVQVVKREER